MTNITSFLARLLFYTEQVILIAYCFYLVTLLQDLHLETPH